MSSDSANSKLMKFLKSLRFRLTLVYSLILFLFTSSFVLGMNIFLNDFFSREIVPTSRTGIVQQYANEKPFVKFLQDQEVNIRELRMQELVSLQEMSLISLIPISVLSFLLGYVVSGKFLFPLKVLNEKVQGLGDKDLGSQVDVYSEDEIGELAESFNNMSVRLKKSFDSQFQFVQDASHELRTPLTIVQTNLDNALEDKAASKEEMKNSIANALDGMKRITKLTSYLLDLTSTNVKLKSEESVSKVVKEQYMQLKELAEQAGVDLTFSAAKGNYVKWVDKISLGRAIYNIVENGIKYSRDVKNPSVAISLKMEGSNVMISIKDNGAGIPKEFQSKVFERFYRVDKSRSRKSGGFGLGLSIAKKIIEDHGGKISLNSSDKGTEFIVKL